jgi:serine/threonine protein phosphatase PrpC
MKPADTPPSPAGLRWSGMTHTGRFRPNNEDTFLALKYDGREVTFLGKIGEAPLAGAEYVFAVSDGMGGARSGEFASRISIDRITKVFPRFFRLSSTAPAGEFSEILLELFTSIHADLQQLGRSYEECSGMGATLSLCWFRPGWLHFGHVGDTRVYHLPRAGGLVQLTHDHSHVGWLRRKGELNEREARTHPRKNALHQALGAGHQFIEPQIGALEHRPGDRFLICSDGLLEGLWERRIEAIVRSSAAGPNAAQALVEESIAASGRDNTTALLVEMPPTGAA